MLVATKDSAQDLFDMLKVPKAGLAKVPRHAVGRRRISLNKD